MKAFLARTLRFLHTTLWIGVVLLVAYTGYFFWSEKAAHDLMLDDAFNQSLGPADAPIVLVAVTDYRCIHCRELDSTLKKVLAENKDVRIIYKYVPVYGELSLGDIRLAMAAGRLGKFPQMHDYLMTQNEELDDNGARALLSGMGLDITEVQSLISGGEVMQAAVRAMSAASFLGVDGVPALIHDGTVYNRFHGMPTTEDFSNFLNQIRAKS